MAEKKTLEFLYSRYVDDMNSYALYLGFNENDIMDAIHDVFYHLFENEKRLAEMDHAKYYLFRSLRNKLIDIAKKNNKEISFDNIEHFEHIFPETGKTTEERLISEEEEAKIKSQINGMMQKLSAQQKEILYLRYIHEYDYQQIAGLMAMNYDNCRKLVYKAIQTLRKKSDFPILFIISNYFH